MPVHLFEDPEGTTIAREDGSGGEFFLRADGSVWYRSIYGHEPEAAAPDVATFRLCATALNRYQSDVVKVDPNDNAGAMVFVRQLVQGLRDAGMYPAPPEALWALIVEQAENGML